MKAPSMKELERLADAALEAKLVADEALEQANDAKSRLEAALEAAHKLSPDMKALGHTRLRISANRFFDEAKAVTLVPEEVIAECTVPKLDLKTLKLHMTPLQVEQAMTTHAKAWKVGIDVLTD